MRILIVDDDAIALELLRRALAKAGHDVLTATNGAEALGHVRTGGFRVVISDWEMPEMTGTELCRAIRQQDQLGYVYIILLSARGQKDVVEGLTAGADDFITKPFNPAELTLRVGIGQRILGLETRDLTIFAMAKLAESRDPETGAHVERVCNYSRLLSQELSRHPQYAATVDPAFVRMIYLTASLHDIGKVAIPDCVLLKPGRLSDREFEMMKEHTTLGASTLEAALREHPEASFLTMARNIAATHHERWDGTGYPAKLKGEDIPLCGRIVAVADVYDALTSKRVYKSAFTHDVAKGIIINDSGTHFDPAIVDAFLAVEQQFIEVSRKFSEIRAMAA